MIKLIQQMPSFPFYKQLDAMDCGPSCLRMIAKYYGRSFSLQTLRDKSYITREVEFVFIKQNDTTNVMLPEIRPGDTYYFRIPTPRDLNISAFFIPPAK